MHIVTAVGTDSGSVRDTMISPGSIPYYELELILLKNDNWITNCSWAVQTFWGTLGLTKNGLNFKKATKKTNKRIQEVTLFF